MTLLISSNKQVLAITFKCLPSDMDKGSKEIYNIG